MAKLELIRPDEALLAQGSNAVMATAGYYARAIEELLGKLAAVRRDNQELIDAIPKLNAGIGRAHALARNLKFTIAKGSSETTRETLALVEDLLNVYIANEEDEEK